MRLGSFILTYNRPAVLEQTINALLTQTRVPDFILVVDNGTGADAHAVVRSTGDARVGYEATGENLGSAGGVAFGMRRLAEAGFDWIHSVDDDDPPRTRDTVEQLSRLIARNPEGDVGAVGATGTRWDWTRGQHARIPDHELRGDVEVDTIGGGQHLTVRREVIEEIGTPDPAFFFGFYDPLYCLRLRQAGYRLLVPGELTHSYRELTGRLNLQRSRAIRPRDPLHATWRRYYVTRNYIYRMSRTFERPDLARREAGRAVARSLASWLNGPRYGARFTTLQLRGVVDGYRGKLGRRVEPRAKP